MPHWWLTRRRRRWTSAPPRKRFCFLLFSWFIPLPFRARAGVGSLFVGRLGLLNAAGFSTASRRHGRCCSRCCGGCGCGGRCRGWGRAARGCCAEVFEFLFGGRIPGFWFSGGITTTVATATWPVARRGWSCRARGRRNPERGDTLGKVQPWSPPFAADGGRPVGRIERAAAPRLLASRAETRSSTTPRSCRASTSTGAAPHSTIVPSSSSSS